MTKKENIINFIIVVIVILLVSGFAIYFITKKNDNDSFVHKISVSELKEKINNKESFVLVYTQDTCSHCKAYMPTLESVGKQYKINFYDVSSTGLKNDDLNYLKQVANTSGTPTTIFIVNGEEKSTLDRLSGNVEEYKLVERLKKMGYINE